MSALSIIIPVSSDIPGFKGFLDRLLQAVAPLNGSDIIVVDGTAGGAVASIGRHAGVCVIRGQGRRLRQMYLGATYAHSDYLLFIEPHITLPADFADIWWSTRRAGPGWGFFPLRARRAPWKLRWLAKMISLRSRISGIAVEDQPLFVRRDLWSSASGSVELKQDRFFDLCHRLRTIAFPWVMRQSVETQGASWKDASLGRLLCASLSSRLHLVASESPSVGVRPLSTKANTGRKHTPELP